MMDLNQTRVFVEVVRAGGFAAAARRLGLPKSTVSARVQALEARLGAQLLKRSTRHLSLTAEGSAFFETVAGAVDTLVDAEAASTAERGGPLVSLSSVRRGKTGHPRIADLRRRYIMSL